MSTATLDTPPVNEALPSIADAYKASLKDVKAKEGSEVSPEPDPAKEAAPVKQPELKAKEAPAKEVKAEPVKEPPVGKKKSALDAALADDTSTEAAPELDEPEEIKLYDKEPTKENWLQSRKNFQRVSAEMRELQAKLAKPEIPADVAAQLTAAKEYKSQLDKLQAENAKMRDNILALDVRFDPVTQEKLAARDAGVSRLASQLKDAGADAEAFAEAMALPLAKRGKFLDAILDSIESGRTRAFIERQLSDIEVEDAKLDEQLSKPHKSFEELKQQRMLAEQQHMEHMEKFKTATFEKVQRDLPKLSKLMRLAPADAEGAADYNAALQADLAKAPSLLEVEPEVAAQAAFKAARYDTVEKLYVESRARISELEDYVAKLEGAEPGFRGGGKQKEKAAHEVPIEQAYFGALKASQGEG